MDRTDILQQKVLELRQELKSEKSEQMRKLLMLFIIEQQLVSMK
jgi:hypothetical protein